MHSEDGKIVFLLLFTAAFASSTSVAALYSFLPLYWQAQGVWGTSLTLILCGYALIKIFVGPTGGWASRHIRPEVLIVMGAFMILMTTAGYLTLPPTFAGFFVLQLLQGAGLGLIRPLAMTIISNCAEPGKKGRILNYFEISFYLSLALGPVLGGALHDSFGMNTLFRVCLILNGVALGATLPLLICCRPRHCPALKTLKESTIPSGVTTRLFYYAFTRAFGIFAMSLMLPLWLGARLEYSCLEIGLLVGATHLASVLTLSLSAGWVDRKAEFFVIWGSLLSSLLLLFIPLTTSYFTFTLIAIATGCLSALAKGGSIKMLVASNEKERLGTAIGTYQSFMNCGFLAASFSSGLFTSSSIDFGLIFVLCACVNMAGTLILMKSHCHLSIKQAGSFFVNGSRP